MSAVLVAGRRDELIRISAQYKYALSIVFDVFAYDYAVFIEGNVFLSITFFCLHPA